MGSALLHFGILPHNRRHRHADMLLASRQCFTSIQHARRSSQHIRQPIHGTVLAASVQPFAQVAENGVLTDLLTTTLAGGIIAGVTLSALPLLSGRAQVGSQ